MVALSLCVVVGTAAVVTVSFIPGPGLVLLILSALDTVTASEAAALILCK